MLKALARTPAGDVIVDDKDHRVLRHGKIVYDNLGIGIGFGQKLGHSDVGNEKRTNDHHRHSKEKKYCNSRKNSRAEDFFLFLGDDENRKKFFGKMRDNPIPKGEERDFRLSFYRVNT